MRRSLALAIVMALLVLAVPAAASAARGDRCRLSVSPERGSPTDVYRATVTGIPTDPAGGSVELQIHVRRLGTHEGSVFFLFLVPGATTTYVDMNQTAPGEPVERMTAGRYLVSASTPHLRGCHTTDRFVVS